MNLRQLPIIPTIVVLVAAGIMVWLGIWQLSRAEEKAALIAKFEANQQLPVVVGFRPTNFRNPEKLKEIINYDRSYLESMQFRTVEFDCSEPKNWQAISGKHANGQSGYVHMFECDNLHMEFMGGEELDVSTFAVVGWSRSVEPIQWAGGKLTGVFAPLGENYKVVASEPLVGLEPLAKPDPRDLPNNHLAYAGQWFFFALTALVIYLLAIRKKLTERREGED